MGFNIKNNIYLVGNVDWEIESYQGYKYSTHKGTSYNAYLIKEQKNVLIDTVDTPFTEVFIRNLKNEIDLKNIDYIVINHGEPDHTGALPTLMKLIPDTPIYCTKNAIKSLRGQYHQDWNFNIVKTGDKLDLGDKELVFVEMPLLHWPDSMLCYLTKDNMIFSNDAFGQHYATSAIYNDLVDQCELQIESLKYYANILTPYNLKVIKKIEEILSLNLAIDMICPSHGVIWRDNPAQIIELYLKWAQDYQENQITILYDTMWESTSIMAEAMAEGIRKSDETTIIKLVHLSKQDKNDVITEIFKSKAILVGSPTVNKGVLSSISAIFEIIKSLEFKNKKAASFGSYGWSGESTKIINTKLLESGFSLVNDGLQMMWKPDEDAIKECTLFAKEFSDSLKDEPLT
ncbi:MAG: anaerobic nitric oxide reductase flavorubredoxin [Sulfurimonas sp.]|jgi:flavorubredoxin|uniref:anaerobic nitric oxide reductase flavorubredoxin n=1 Tax=Sulfurimonas sp. TaxID=2022749 RepID=UPI00262AEF61|nr:anaerobic nitric oxide reductase flavorubredoxin [Sulfurimonas sp.]MDD3475664.1 anaerobic nitric oxide reductase flavorubredoxin [Sulfurimonas sp.]